MAEVFFVLDEGASDMHTQNVLSKTLFRIENMSEGWSL